MTPSAQKTDSKSFLSGRLTQVDPDGIERELRRLWAQAADGVAAGTHPDVVRACSFNLVLFSGDEDAESKCGEILSEIVSHHPCRSILAIYRPEKPSHLEAWVSAACHLTGAALMKQICCEQITVVSEGQGSSALPSVVAPLLIRDLPVFLWWRANQSHFQIMEKLLCCCRRLIIDSGREPFNLPFLMQAAELTALPRKDVFASDLNWRRLLSWCQSLGNAFDGFPLSLDYLFTVRQVKILHSGQVADRQEISCQSLLLASWMAARLGWQPTSFLRNPDGTATAAFSYQGSTVQIHFAPKADSLPAGSVVSLTCTFLDERHLEVSYQLRQGSEYIVAATDSPDGRAEELEPTALTVSESDLIGQEVEVICRDAVYEATMNMVYRLIDMLSMEK